MPVTYIPFIKVASIFPPGTQNIARYDTIALDNNTTGKNFSCTWTDHAPFYFTDSGTGEGDYGDGDDFSITFWSTAGLRFWIHSNGGHNYHDFEKMSFSMYDRLGFQVSNTGEKGLVNFQSDGNITEPWLQKSASSKPPWSRSFAGGSYRDPDSLNGYIFPADTRRSEELGLQEGRAMDVNYTCIRFYFTADNYSQERGWHFSVYPLEEKKEEEPPKEEPPRR